MPNTEPMDTMDTATAQRVEQEKITRRAALRKLGFGAGLAAFSLLGVDDLARMVGKRLEQMAGDNKIAGKIAKEFQEAGIALANPSSPPCSGSCENCCSQHGTDENACLTQLSYCTGIMRQPQRVCQQNYTNCITTANTVFSNCWTNNTCGNCNC